MTLWKFVLITFTATTVCSFITTLIILNYIGSPHRVNRQYDVIHNVNRQSRALHRDVTTLEMERITGELDAKKSKTLQFIIVIPQSTNWYPIEVIHHELFIQSAIVNHHHSNDTHHAVMVTAWNYYRHQHTFQCCFVTASGDFITSRAIFMFRHVEGWLGAHQFRCDISKNSTIENRVYFSASTNCSDHVTRSLPIVFPERREGKMAVCIKALYNNVSAGQLVEWFEIQKLQGVDKIQGFHYQLQKEARMVLEYYRKQGYLILLPFEFPVGKAAPPGRGFLEQDRPDDAQFQGDEQIMVFDCTGRLSGYDYVGVYDVDEIIVTKERNISLPTFFKKMEMLQPEAGAFRFKVEYFVTDWGKSNNDTDLTFMSYVQRMFAKKDRMKLVHIPAKLLWQDTHHAATAERFAVSQMSWKTAVIHHYRTCRHEKGKSCNRVMRFDDFDLLRYETALKVRVDREKTEIAKQFDIFQDRQ